MEARLIGLGISFTTCVSLHCDGQEFTRGNSINYWNNAVDTVLELPRPIRKCGIVYLKTKNNSAGQLFRVRPDIVRRALCWLIEHNTLYKNVGISEDNLAALKEFDVESYLPSISLTDEEAQELVLQQNAVNNAHVKQTSLSEGGDQSDHIDSTSENCRSENINLEVPIYTTQSQNDSPSGQLDPSVDLVESFELERNENDTKTELQRIVEAANVVSEDSQYPVKELQRHTNSIDEYKTELIVQNCFPTLFPNGKGGFNIIDGENRLHEFHLAEFCCQLMKWHDRHFVIHPNFKFFCINLIQRRQIDGLVRRFAIATMWMKRCRRERTR
ncbi:hypothetical protein AM588_10001753 [Phytophthora nicotianae]|uniref:DUF6570 domain-containing protein n=1 Tax=Phytophthora nicotianae TaxID=4792 RepID=A0A0W8CVT0_PHYNI|nr:hypothetical protein AM588_10001753 [Phytophthora nicotianae]